MDSTLRSCKLPASPLCVRCFSFHTYHCGLQLRYSSLPRRESYRQWKNIVSMINFQSPCSSSGWLHSNLTYRRREMFTDCLFQILSTLNIQLGEASCCCCCKWQQSPPRARFSCFRAVWSWLHRSCSLNWRREFTKSSAVALCCPPGENNKASSRQVTVLRQSNARSGPDHCWLPALVKEQTSACVCALWALSLCRKVQLELGRCSS